MQPSDRLVIERPLLQQDHPLESPQLPPRLQAGAVLQSGARLPERRERLALSPRAVEREHQQRPEPLAVGRLPDPRAQLRYQLAVSPLGEARLHEVLLDQQPQLLQALALEPHRLQLLHALERAAAHEIQRRARAAAPPRLASPSASAVRAARRQRLEAVDVELPVLDGQPIAAPLGRDRRRPPRPRASSAAARRRCAPSAPRSPARPLPEAVHDDVGRDELVPPRRQERQHRPLLRRSRIERPSPMPHRERAQEAEAEPGSPPQVVARADSHHPLESVATSVPREPTEGEAPGPCACVALRQDRRREPLACTPTNSSGSFRNSV